MRAQIRPNRLEVSDRFPMLGFTIRTDESPARAEVAVATDPSLFRADRKGQRTLANFHSSRTAGPLLLPRGEAVYLLPPEVLARFVGQERLYAALAVTPERNGHAPEVAVLPGEGSPYVSLQGLTGRSLKRVRVLPGRQDRMRGYGPNGTGTLEWAGDAASPGVEGLPSPPANGSARPGNGAAAAAPYDDGFGPMPVAAPAPVPAAPPVAAAAARAFDLSNVTVGGERTPVQAPSVVRLDTAQTFLVEAALAALAGPMAPTIAAVRLAARAANVSIGVGPSVGAGLGAGIGLGAGVVFGPDGGIGVYGAVEFQAGFLASISATAQITIVSGGIESFSGWGLAASVSGGEGLVGGASALFDLNGTFQGVSFQLGVGVGLSPVDFYVAVQRQVAVPLTTAQARARALSNDIPLDPGNGGMSIGADALEIGDIIVSTTAAAISGAIRFATGSEVSHAMLYVGQGGQVVDATAAGVQLRPLAEAVGDATVAVAFRYPGLSDAQRQIIADKAGQYIGSSYNYWGIVRQGRFQVHRTVCDVLPETAAAACRNFYGRVDMGSGSSGDFFCSELIVAAYQEAGVPLTSTPPSWSSPDDLAQLGMRHGVLAYVGHLKAPPYEQRSSIWGALGLARAQARGRALALESFSINWDDVQAVNQPNDVTCWAASAAMVVGWRDLQSLTPEYLAQCAGRTTVSGLNPSDRRQFATDIGLVYEEPQSYSIDAFRNLLETCGPLWVSVQLPGSGHAIVVTGMYSDGAPDGSDTFVRITDPWDRVVGTPGAPGNYLNTHDTGSRYILTWADFTREYENRASTSPSGTVNAQILHAGGTGGRVPNRQTTPPGYAMALSRSLAHRRPAVARAPAARARGLADAPASGPDAVLERARLFGPDVADVVARLIAQGARPDDVSAFMDRLAAACPPAPGAVMAPPMAPVAAPVRPAPPMAPPDFAGGGSVAAPPVAAQARATVRALEGEHRAARFPGIRVASDLEKGIALAAVSALSPATAGLILGLRAVANRYNVSIGVGPAASVGFLIGGGVGAGIIFAPGDQVGFYGQFDIRGGLIDSASIELQITIVSGGIESFGGISWALAVELDFGVSISAQALFDTSLNFQGVTFGLGVGYGVEPIQVFLSLQGTYAARAAALAAPSRRALSRVQTRWALPFDEATGAVVPPPFPGAGVERVEGSSGTVRWRLDQLRGIKQPPGTAGGSAVSVLAPTVRLSDWPYLDTRDGSASLPLTVDWEYDTAGVGNIRIAAGEPRSAGAAGLDVSARIVDVAAPAPNGPAVAALKVEIEYRFTAPDGTTPVGVTELVLYGDGQFERRSRWRGALAA